MILIMFKYIRFSFPQLQSINNNITKKQFYYYHLQYYILVVIFIVITLVLYRRFYYIITIFHCYHYDEQKDKMKYRFFGKKKWILKAKASGKIG